MFLVYYLQTKRVKLIFKSRDQRQVTRESIRWFQGDNEMKDQVNWLEITTRASIPWRQCCWFLQNILVKDCKHKPCSRIRGKSLTLGEILDRQMESGQMLLEKLGTPNCAQYCGGGVSDSKENISVCHSLIRRQNVLQTCIVDLVAKCINNHSAIPVSTKTWWNVIHEFTRLFLSRFYFFSLHRMISLHKLFLLTHIQDVGRQTIVLQLCWHIE